MSCPICDKPTDRCTCKYGSDHCGRCGQPIGANAMASRMLTKFLTPKPDKKRRNTGTAQFVRRLALEGGHIVSTASLTPEQIIAARESKRLFVMGDGLGFVIVPNGPLRNSETGEGKTVDGGI